LLYYGGIWLDCSILTNIKFNEIKFNIFINSLYSSYGELDFIESSYLHFYKNNIIIKKLFNLFKFQLTLTDYSIYKGQKGKKIMSLFEKISNNISRTPSYWSNYLIIYGCHAWLYNYDSEYNTNFKKLIIGDYNSMGYNIHNFHKWNLKNVFKHIDEIIGLGVNYFFKLTFSHLTNIKSPFFFNKNDNYFKLVIARYNEDITWSNIYSGNRVIYNKGPNINNFILTPGDKYQNIPNVGRESHTFIQYIIENYHNLPKYVGFSQGSLKDHDWVRKKWGPKIFLNMLKEANINGFSSYLTYDSNNKDWNLKFNYEIAKKYDKNVFNSNITFFDFLKDLGIYGDFYNNKLKIYPSAFMVISKENILSRPKSYYEKIINYCNYHINPIEGHYFERTWAYIFNCNELNVKKVLYYL
jgi:hypothetical protein